MAWISIHDDFINLDGVRMIEFAYDEDAVVVRFIGDYGYMIVMYRMSEESAEKLKRALYYATKAVPVSIEAPRSGRVSELIEVSE